ncbi:hypothetical protein OG21DRAFT_1509798 [Imleria badia]|nr:hypothetical protein OG21DRAFT_1509798 [Imleria badia]
MEQHALPFPRYRPYPPRDGPTPIQLRFAARTIAPSSHLTMTMEDVEQGNALLPPALDHFPQELLLRAYEDKRADRDSVVHNVALAAAEVEFLWTL